MSGTFMYISQGWVEIYVMSGHKCSIHLLAFPPLTHMDMGNVFEASGTLKTLAVRTFMNIWQGCIQISVMLGTLS